MYNHAKNASNMASFSGRKKKLSTIYHFISTLYTNNIIFLNKHALKTFFFLTQLRAFKKSQWAGFFANYFQTEQL